MLLSHLLKNVPHSEIKENVNVTSIVSDSRQVTKGCVFVCIKGENFDSHTLARDVLNDGAVAVIVQSDLEIPEQIIVEDTKKALALMCAEFYHNSHKKMKIIGVTGTNGKTSTTYMIKQILEYSGKKAGLIGTVAYSSGKEKISDSVLTTPEPQQLHRMFYSMQSQGCEYCVMEVSSQALAQERCHGIEFDCAVFTNLTTDHLDYHKTMENYCTSKGKLFAQSKLSLINADDKNGQLIFGFVKGRAQFFSAKTENADFYAHDVKLEKDGCEYTLGNVSFKIPIPGEFTVYNSIGAVACCNAMGISLEDCAKALSKMSGVPGRAEVLETDTPYTVIIDYAHTPDAMENILSTVKAVSKGRVVALFGCGGNRDKSKRPLMAKAAAENADYVIITTDNPRTENPNEIIEDILPGIKNISTPCAVIPDRTYAIEFALKNAKENDTIVLCGKGHETYQIIGENKHPYDERKIVRNYLKK
ncbi:MAG: UDP-N-acetylmuramoyl-L-alanyl-D-glutamate--2,6-diaminopimelate ligase [Clostridia bacterium]|nr:UDP-N-acetylmuramoyl-L-alanyl-D-glutamate--2,6-diaminopimelate ligase [Clostridia bacterium]